MDWLLEGSEPGSESDGAGAEKDGPAIEPVPDPELKAPAEYHLPALYNTPFRETRER